MSKDEKCPVCNRYHTYAYAGCSFPIEYRELVRDLQRRAEIGARAVEVLNQRWFWNQTDVLESLMADARAAGMVP